MNQATFSKGFIDESNLRYTSNNSASALIRKGDLLMASTGGGVLGKVVFFDKEDNDFYADSHVSILRNSKGTNSMKFLYYWFSTRYEEINATMVKGSTNQTELQRNYLVNYEIDMPSLEVQQRIVSYLDAETAKIDHAIELLKKKREAYTRLKSSVINRAVTRGLNPNVNLKDSGVEWIGMIPERWEVKRVKDIAKRIGSGTTPSSNVLRYYDSDDYHWINTGDFNNTEIYGGKQMISQSAIDEIKTLRFYPIDTILIAMYGASIGKVGILKVKATVNQACCAIIPKTDEALSRFLFYLFINSKDYLLRSSFGGTQPNVSQFIISNWLLPFPPIHQQHAITDYLDSRCARIDKASAIVDKQIDAYTRLKKSLINEVVTGKRKV